MSQYSIVHLRNGVLPCMRSMLYKAETGWNALVAIRTSILVMWMEMLNYTDIVVFQGTVLIYSFSQFFPHFQRSVPD